MKDKNWKFVKSDYAGSLRDIATDELLSICKWCKRLFQFVHPARGNFPATTALESDYCSAKCEDGAWDSKGGQP